MKLTRAIVLAAAASAAGAARAVALAAADLREAEERIMAALVHDPESLIPNRVSIERDSPHFWPQYKKLGVKIDGQIRNKDVVEYCVSEGWAIVFSRNAQGQLRIDREKGVCETERVIGVIEPYWINKDQRRAGDGDAARLAAAEAKRQRKAAKLAAQFHR